MSNSGTGLLREKKGLGIYTFRSGIVIDQEI
jgi:hypothetical protein